MAGFKTISGRQVTQANNQVTTKISDVPDTPTIGTATKSTTTASVTFTAAATGGAATSFQVSAFVDGTITSPLLSGTGSASPISVTGLTTGTAYTFKAKAINTSGSSAYSASSNSITP